MAIEDVRLLAIFRQVNFITVNFVGWLLLRVWIIIHQTPGFFDNSRQYRVVVPSTFCSKLLSHLSDAFRPLFCTSIDDFGHRTGRISFVLQLFTICPRHMAIRGLCHLKWSETVTVRFGYLYLQKHEEDFRKNYMAVQKVLISFGSLYFPYQHLRNWYLAPETGPHKRKKAFRPQHISWKILGQKL